MKLKKKHRGNTSRHGNEKKLFSIIIISKNWKKLCLDIYKQKKKGVYIYKMVIYWD